MRRQKRNGVKEKREEGSQERERKKKEKKEKRGDRTRRTGDSWRQLETKKTKAGTTTKTEHPRTRKTGKSKRQPSQENKDGTRKQSTAKAWVGPPPPDNTKDGGQL